jgi:GTP-binding protein EngB required for normal cell division
MRAEPNSLALDESIDRALINLKAICEEFQLRAESKQIADRLRDHSHGFIIMVVGEGNFGKSTLINAITGMPVAPVGILPKTFKVDVFTNRRLSCDRALVRIEGAETYEEYSWEDAALLCQVAEEQARSGNHSDLIAEVIWETDAPGLPEGCSLVDTPGLSQDRLGNVSVVSLTSGITLPFQDDGVWAHWYHRADLILWAFQANKFESEPSHQILSKLLQRHSTPIIPVATKADLIKGDFDEAKRRFRQTFCKQLDEAVLSELQFVIADNRKADGGLGIQQLRGRIQEISVVAAERKLLAHQLFIQDLADSLRDRLEHAAQNAVKGLRDIASVGDATTLESERVLNAAVARAEDAMNSHIRERCASFDTYFSEVLKRATTLHQQGVSMREVQKEVNRLLLDYADVERMHRILNESLNRASHEIRGYANYELAQKSLSVLDFTLDNSSMPQLPDLIRSDLELSSQSNSVSSAYSPSAAAATGGGCVLTLLGYIPLLLGVLTFVLIGMARK